MNTSIITCTRRLQFCAGHRVVGHENKCRNFHGHNYVVLLTAQARVAVAGNLEGNPLDALGRVIDFSVLKHTIGAWIEAAWDHGMILWEGDPLFSNISGIPEQKHYALPYNPTAENLAKYLLEVAAVECLADLPVKVVRVRVWETENCYADAELSVVPRTV